MPTCRRCDEDRDVTTHYLYFSDDRDREPAKLCPVCVRRLREQSNDIRSIT